MSKNYTTSKSLLCKLKERYDESAWEEFAATYRGYIYRIIVNLDIDKHDAEDLLQTVMLKLWQRLPDLDYNPEKGRFRYFIVRITKNYVYKFLNREGRKKSVITPGEDLVESSTLEPEIEKLAEKEWRLFVSEKAWDNISPQFNDTVKQVFLMNAEGISYEEIAEKLDIKVSAAYVYRQRIRKALQSEISRLEYELG